MSDLEEQVRRWRGVAAESARGSDCRVAALASSPLPMTDGPTPSRGERFARIHEQFQQIAQDQLSCGLHVHVSVTSDDEGVAVLDRIRGWLPALPALTANSPFAQGKDTGFASWRTQVMRAWPSSGPPPVFDRPRHTTSS